MMHEIVMNLQDPTHPMHQCKMSLNMKFNIIMTQCKIDLLNYISCMNGQQSTIYPNYLHKISIDCDCYIVVKWSVTQSTVSISQPLPTVSEHFFVKK